MNADDPQELDMEALIEAIWGPNVPAAPVQPDRELRERQNRALGAALTAYLQRYFAESHRHCGDDDDT